MEINVCPFNSFSSRPTGVDDSLSIHIYVLLTPFDLFHVMLQIGRGMGRCDAWHIVLGRCTLNTDCEKKWWYIELPKKYYTNIITQRETIEINQCYFSQETITIFAGIIHIFHRPIVREPIATLQSVALSFFSSSLTSISIFLFILSHV